MVAATGEAWRRWLRNLDYEGPTPAGPVAVYLAFPPESALDTLAAASRSESSRVVVEKPFGHDLAPACRRNELIQRAFPERSVFFKVFSESTAAHGSSRMHDGDGIEIGPPADFNPPVSVSM